MKRIASALLPTLAFLILPSTPFASAQEQSLKKDIVGTWMLEKSIQKHSDGSEIDAWGKERAGHTVFGADGSYTQVYIGTKDPTRKSADVRVPDTPVVALVGTYSVDPDNKTVRVKVQRGANSIRNGTEFADVVTVNGDEMTITGGPRSDAKGSFTPIQTLKRFRP